MTATYPAQLKAAMPALRRYARSLTRDLERAEDLIQDTLARATAKAALFQPGTNYQSWLMCIMHNIRVNDACRAGRAELVDIETQGYLAASDDAAAGAVIADLRRTLALLPADQRRVIMMRASGEAYESIARREGIPVGTVRSRLSRGRDRLRELWGG